MKTYLLILVVALWGIGCQSPKSLYKQGNLQGAIQLATQKIRSGNTSDKHRLVLEQAFNESVQAELKRIEQLKLEGNPANWEKVLSLYQSIDYKQSIVKPLLPIYIQKEYRNADIKIVDIDEAMANAKNYAAEFLYTKGNVLLQQKTKYSAREAFYQFSKINSLYPDYKDVRLKIDSAKQRGTNLVLIDYKNNSPMMVPKSFIQELMHLSATEFTTEWASFITRLDGRKVDNIIVINLKNIAVSPEQIRDRHFTESTQVKDGFVYEYDSAGRIKKDRDGKEVKRYKYINVYATVHEIAQHKQGVLEGSFDVFNYNSTELYHSEPFRTDLIFDHIACTYFGDRRALSDAVMINVGKRPIPFPTNEQMMMDGIATVKGNLRGMIRSNRAAIEK